MKPTPTTRSRRGALKSRSGSRPKKRPPENLVAEIVDQITEKQVGAQRLEAIRSADVETCSLCTDEATASSAYRLVLRCRTGDSPEAAG